MGLPAKRLNYFKSAGFLFFISLALTFLLLFRAENKKTRLIRSQASGSEISVKKGVGGGATLSQLQELKASWFHNWNPNPGYKSLDNYDPEVWKKFVPLFFGKSYEGVGVNMEKICSRTGYCGKGNYYLVGNEPDQTLQDAIVGSEDQVGDAVFMQGEVIKRVKAFDPTAKFIILGTATPNRAFAYEFIRKWKTRWQGDLVLADLSAIIKGWHIHTYFCHPSNTSIEQFKSTVDSEMQVTFGKTVADGEIWITEMGRLDGGDPFGIMDCLINKYEFSNTAKIVMRYAWFYFGCSPGMHRYCPFPSKNYNLYIQNTITDLGKKYAGLPVVVLPTVTPIPAITLFPSPTLTTTPPVTNFPPTVTNTPIPTEPNCPLKEKGDADCNGRVNLPDFLIWRGEFLNPKDNLRADFNFDGITNLADFFNWRNGFLQSLN